MYVLLILLIVCVHVLYRDIPTFGVDQTPPIVIKQSTSNNDKVKKSPSTSVPQGIYQYCMHSNYHLPIMYYSCHDIVLTPIALL